MSEITITGDPKQIYNIVKEQRIRIKRGMVEVSGDVDSPHKELAKIAAKKAKAIEDKRIKEEKEAEKEAKKLKDKAENDKLASAKENYEKIIADNKAEIDRLKAEAVASEKQAEATKKAEKEIEEMEAKKSESEAEKTKEEKQEKKGYKTKEEKGGPDKDKKDDAKPEAKKNTKKDPKK